MPVDENEVIEELKESEQIWDEFRSYCIGVSAANLQYIMQMR